MDDTTIADALVKARNNLRRGAQGEAVGAERERFSVDEAQKSLPNGLSKTAFAADTQQEGDTKVRKDSENTKKETTTLAITSPSIQLRWEHQNKVVDTKVRKDFENERNNEDLFARAERIARDYDDEMRMSADYERMEVADWYERLMSSGRYQSIEAFMDSMFSLKKVMEKIAPLKQGEHVEDIPWYENAYMGENSLSSRDEAELNAVRALLVDPLMQVVSRLTALTGERITSSKRKLRIKCG